MARNLSSSSLDRPIDGLEVGHVSQSSTASTTPPPSLFTLPPELRNRILSNVVTLRNPQGELVIFDYKKIRLYPSKVTGTLKVNPQMRGEVIQLFYGRDIFRILSVSIESSGPGELVHITALSPHPVRLASERLYDTGTKNPHPYYITIPPKLVRPILKHLCISVQVLWDGRPPQDSHVDGHNGIWRPYFSTLPCHRHHSDWLYILRNLRTLGFRALEMLHTELMFEKGSDKLWNEALKMIKALAIKAKSVTVSCKNFGAMGTW